MKELCPACSSQRWYKFLKKEKRDILICKTCGLGKLSPFPTEEELIQFYTSSYRKDHSKQELVSKEVVAYEQKRADHLLPLIKDTILVAKKSLDIGSSSGTLIKNFRSINPDIIAYGLELNEEYLKFSIDNEFVESKHTLKEPIEKIYNKLDNDFDIITLVHVLEHLYNPLETLEAIYKILKPGGMLYVEVPNMRTPYGDRLVDYFPIYHLYYYSQKTIIKILKKTGFEIATVHPQGMGKYKISIGVVARKTSEKQETKAAPNDSYIRLTSWLRAYFFLRQSKLKALRIFQK